jgi:hypothetical protein
MNIFILTDFFDALFVFEIKNIYSYLREEKRGRPVARLLNSSGLIRKQRNTVYDSLCIPEKV